MAKKQENKAAPAAAAAPKHPRKKRFQFAASRIGPDGRQPEEVYKLQALMARYGYLRQAYTPGRYDKATQDAVSQFQAFYRIEPDQDGVADEQTIALLNQPRCGMPDPPPGSRSATGRLASFVTVGAKWNTSDLRFRFLNSTGDLPESRQRDIIRDAFQRWQQVSGLRFTEVAASEPAQLSIAFHQGSHGDGAPFDDAGGPDGNTLAHAFFPPPAGGTFAGSLHFDESEQWKDLPGGPGIRLFNVALHEIGHNLGLDHSQDQNAIMFAFYAENRNDLQTDDIAGIRSLYGGPPDGPTVVSVGERVSGHLPGTNAEIRYQVTLQNKLLIKLEGPPGQDFDLYVRYGAPAGTQPGQYDSVSWGVTADELVTINNPQAGTYHILVHSYRGNGSYNLEVDVA